VISPANLLCSKAFRQYFPKVCIISNFLQRIPRRAWFLSIAAKKKFIVESYTDRAIGIMDKNEDGKLAITTVRLCPQVTFIGDDLPTEQQIEKMHDEAHYSCFLANSVKTHITVAAVAA
jgi:organic hydroperoxide reductase OsmC/OhrA